ncbi:MAG: pantetheine-phosphate adenylyltransferase [Planctomycetales bacterium]|nr:pantetheine-phosphate adenylyltransferase [Planctomycetales bacterium]
MPGALYPGSFDPPTHGHLDLVRRAAAAFGRVVVAVAENPEKSALFSVKERLEMLREVTAGIAGAEVSSYSGLTVEAARGRGCTVIFRGVRSVTDFEYEFSMTMTSRVLAPDVDTVFVMPSAEWAFLSSRLVREVARLGGDVSRFVPESVAKRLREKLGGKGARKS